MEGKFKKKFQNLIKIQMSLNVSINSKVKSGPKG